MRILVVDDSRAVHMFVDGMFAGKQVELTHAHNGQIACDTFEEGKFDLILLDWERPEKDGLATASEIRQRSAVPIIMVTSKNEVADIERMLSVGVNEYVMKPYTPEILFDKIEQVISKKVA